MPTRNFSEADIEFLGYENVEVLSRALPDGPYQIYRATATVGLSEVKAQFVYLQSSIGVAQIEAVAKAVPAAPDTFVIIPASLSDKRSRIQDAFGTRAQVKLRDDLLWSTLERRLAAYLESLKTGIHLESHFIPPRYDPLRHKSAGSRGRPEADEDFREDLERWLKGPLDTSAGVTVVCAGAGVGKTTLARRVTVDLAERVATWKRIPVYIEASHWTKLLDAESLDDFWSVVQHSLRHFEGPSLTEQQMQFALQSGYVCLIFDGFDELCGHRHAGFNPREMLASLSLLAEASSARIVMTTRTKYWDSEIADSAVPENVTVWYLGAFNTQQAIAYFERLFAGDSVSRERARQLYHELKRSDVPRDPGGDREQFVNLPICVHMIAEYVRSGGKVLATGDGSVVRNVLRGLCDREVERQKLHTTADNQLRALREIAVDYSDSANPSFERSILEVAGFDSRDIGRLTTSFLLSFRGESCSFGYDFLAPFLRAEFLCDYIAAPQEANTKRALALMKKEAGGRGSAWDHLAVLSSGTTAAQIREIYRKVPPELREARSFLFHFASAAWRKADSVRSERTSRILGALVGPEAFEEKNLPGMTFIGTVERLDLRGLRFVDSFFEDVLFSNCLADGTTGFTRCRFAGDLEFQGSSWTEVVTEDCNFEPPTDLVWEEFCGTGKRREDLLRDALRYALGKFWHHGRFKASIRRNDWLKGPLGRSRFSDHLLAALTRNGLISEETGSGVTEGVYVFSREGLYDLQMFMDSRQLTGRVKAVFDDVMRAT